MLTFQKDGVVICVYSCYGISLYNFKKNLLKLMKFTSKNITEMNMFRHMKNELE